MDRSIDFFSVSGKSNPVVCRLMDFKRDEYRKLKMHKKRASEKRVQKKKEIRLRVSRQRQETRQQFAK